ncbi:MAG: sec-independent protein translocase protein TatB [Cellvibrionaceae bacterium]|jgi:sec-independent protein translocase protein TatB
MGFFEILLIAIVTLLVVGPERMPEAVRTVALTIGRLKRSLEGARSEIEKQVGADDIRRQLHNEAIMENLDKIKDGLSDIDKKIATGEREMPWNEDDYDDLDRKYEKEHEEAHKDDATPETDNKNTPTI